MMSILFLIVPYRLYGIVLGNLLRYFKFLRMVTWGHACGGEKYTE